MVGLSLPSSYHHVLKPIAEETSPPVSASVSQQSTTGTPSIRVQPPSLPDTGYNGPAPPSVVARSRTTPTATVSNTLGLLHSPFENTQQHAINTAPTPPSRVVPPATANHSNSPFSFNFQYPKSSDPIPATPHIQPTDSSSSFENQQHHPSSQTHIIPPNPALREPSHSMTVQSARHSSSGTAASAPSMPQADLKRKVADGSSDSSQKRRVTSRAPQSGSRSSHPSSHPTSGQQLSSGPTNEPGRRVPQSTLRSSYPSSHPTSDQQLSSGPTNEPGRHAAQSASRSIQSSSHPTSGQQHASGPTNEPGRLYPHMNVNPVIPTDARSIAAPAPSMPQAELNQRVAGGSNDFSQQLGAVVESRTFTPQPSSRPTSSQRVFSGHTDSHMTVNSPVPLNAPLPPDTAPGRSYSLPPGANLPVQFNTAPIAPAPVPLVNHSPALRPSPYPMSSQQLPSGHTNSPHMNVNSRVNSDAPLAPGTAPGRSAPN